MESIENFKRRVDSLINKALQGNVVLTNFLDEAESIIFKDMVSKNKDIIMNYSGNIKNSLRNRYILSIYDNIDLDFKINLYKIEYNKKYYELNHRNILGSLMSLGIKRECIGDIVIDDFKNAYFAITKEISPYILEEFRFVGNTPIELKIEENEIENVIKYNSKDFFTSSFRLDTIVALGFNLSRSEAQEYIIDELVSINHILTKNTSHLVKLNDFIQVRHKGTILLAYIGNQSKSGKTFITIKKKV